MHHSMDIDTLIELRDELNERIKNYSDGYFYITVVLSYGSQSVEEHSNYYCAYEAIDPYIGDNGIPYMYTDNPEYIGKSARDRCTILSLDDYPEREKFHCKVCSAVSYNANRCKNDDCPENMRD